MKKGNTNAKFHKAKKNKNDEFYTQLNTIEKELQYYKAHFRGKIIYLNCDKEWSNFYKYFKDNKEFLGVKEIIRTSSDFRLPENIVNLKRADIVVTNPPFSLWREYVAQLMEYKKKFLILGSVNCISYKDIFPHLKNESFWVSPRGQSVEEFNLLNGATHKMRGITWYTNLDCGWRTKEKLLLVEKYTPEKYPKYDNYDAINVDRTKDIPKDYYGEMGVPITFLDKHNPKQFEIITLGKVGNCIFTKNKEMIEIKTGKKVKNAKGTLYYKHRASDEKPPAFKCIKTGELYQSVYARVIIKRRKE